MFAIDPAMRRAIRWKLNRLRDGAPPRVVDLFAGCGGMSLGANLAGCEVLAAVELDEAAARSHALNFHDGAAAHGLPRDISGTDPESLLNELAPSRLSTLRKVDLLVGGPPCQAFARVGRAKLREINAHPEAFLHDPRSGLYRDYIRFVESLAPVAVMVENVPDVLNYGGLNVFEIMAGALDELGYDCTYGLLNAAHYGVPQMRLRCFLIGVARTSGSTAQLPPPTHDHALPAGYKGTRDVALRHMGSLFDKTRYSDPEQGRQTLPPAVSAENAIGDLPEISFHLRGMHKKGPQRLKDQTPNPAPASLHAYAALMRNWPSFESDGFVYDHAIRFLPRDYKIFRRMKPGDQYPQAHDLALRMFNEKLVRMKQPPRRGTTAFNSLFSEYVPPYDPGKFPNKWRKMEAGEPARTLMAHIGKDTYSHIHYDSAQARTISVREAARLQSFPDGFRFSGTMNPAFKQIGNAVPPLLAQSVVSAALSQIGVNSPALQTSET